MAVINPETGETADPDSSTTEERREPEDSISERESASESDPMTDLGDTSSQSSPRTGRQPSNPEAETPDETDTTDDQDSGGGGGGGVAGPGAVGADDPPSIDDPTDTGSDGNGGGSGGGVAGPGAVGADDPPSIDDPTDTGGDSVGGPDRGDDPRPTYEDEFVPTGDDSPGTSAAGISQANRLESMLEDRYGERDYEFARVDGDVVARFEQGGQTQAVPIALGGGGVSSGAQEEAARTRVEDQYRGFEAGEDFVITTSSVGPAVELTETGRETLAERDRQFRAGAAAATSGSGELARGTDAVDFAAFQPEVEEITAEMASRQPDLEAGSDYTVEITEDGQVRTNLTQEGQESMAETQRQFQAGAAAATEGPGELARGAPDMLAVVEESQRRREQVQSAFERGALGDTREIRTEQAAASLSEQYGFTVRESDVDVVREDGDLAVRVDPRVAEAGALAERSQVTGTGVDIARTDSGGFDVTVEGPPATSETAAAELEADIQSAGRPETVDVSPVGQATASQQPQSDLLDTGDVPDFAAISRDVTQDTIRTVVQPAAASVGDALDLGLARERGDYAGIAERDVESTTVGRVGEQVTVGTGEGAAALTVGLPSLAGQAGSLAAGSARYTASELAEGDVVDPVVAGGSFAANYAREEARFAAENPARYAGQLAAGAALGGAAGRAGARVAPARLTGGRLSAATRAVVDPVRTSYRVFRRDTRAQGGPPLSLQRQTRRSESSSATQTITADDLSNQRAVADISRGGRFGDRGPARGGDIDITREANRRGRRARERRTLGSTGSVSGLGYRTARTEAETAVTFPQAPTSTRSFGATSAAGTGAGAAAGAAGEPLAILEAAQAPSVATDEAVFGSSEQAQTPTVSTGTGASQTSTFLQPLAVSQAPTTESSIEDTIGLTGTVSADTVSSTTRTGTSTTPSLDTGIGTDTTPATDVGVRPGVTPDVDTRPRQTPRLTPTVTPRTTPDPTPDPTPRPDGDDDDEEFGLFFGSGFEDSSRQFERELVDPLAGPDNDNGDGDRDGSEPVLGGFL